MRSLLCLLVMALFGLMAARADSLALEDDLGRDYWTTLDAKAKPVFLLGYRVGAGLNTSAPLSTPFGVVDKPLSLGADRLPKLVPALDAFYQDPENQRVRLRFAVQICVMQVAGRPAAEIKDVLGKAREFHKQ